MTPDAYELRMPAPGPDIAQARVGPISDAGAPDGRRCDAMCSQPAEFYVISAWPAPEGLDPLVMAVCGGCLVGVVRATLRGET